LKGEGSGGAIKDGGKREDILLEGEQALLYAAGKWVKAEREPRGRGMRSDLGSFDRTRKRKDREEINIKEVEGERADK